MNKVNILPAGSIGLDFLPDEYIPEGKNEFYLRNLQSKPGNRRPLTSDEKKILIENGNLCDDWSKVLVADEFDPNQVRNNRFYGLVRIGSLKNCVLKHNDLMLPAGITGSTVISCDFGDDVAVHNVSYIAYYVIGDRCILSNIDEMHSTNHAKFGNGIVKQGETESVRVWIDLMNETGCRKVLPFDGMLTADAYLWAKYRDDSVLQKRLVEMTQSRCDSRRGFYGTVGKQSVIKNSRILKDVAVGEHAYIKGVNKLKNLTINSSAEEPTQIGEGVELVNGIIGFGCHVFYGCKAVRFILGNNANLKYGARLINSFLGDNSTVSCCEILNNLIFPAHEQHHNNSFLIAAVVKGQSNLAAGATIGSNHNSRSNDNEVQAGRGFWPGLCTSIKHSSRFASFVLLAKGAYPAELDIPFPFSLVNNNESENRLEIMPAYWWMYNMYALARNAWKYLARDRRVNKKQHIEFDYLAPDTVEEIFSAMRFLEIWTYRSFAGISGNPVENIDESEMSAQGRKLLTDDNAFHEGFEVYVDGIEKSKRKVLILKPRESYDAYREMILYYSSKNLLDYVFEKGNMPVTDLKKVFPGERETEWVNMGGQLISAKDVDSMREDIRSGQIGSWDDLHLRYDELWSKYIFEKQRHSFACLKTVLGVSDISEDLWSSAVSQFLSIQEKICIRVYDSREKDYDNLFRRSTFRNDDEMNAAIGTIETNEFILQIRKETEEYRRKVSEIRE